MQRRLPLPAGGRCGLFLTASLSLCIFATTASLAQCSSDDEALCSPGSSSAIADASSNSSNASDVVPFVPPEEGAPSGRIGAGTRAADLGSDVDIELRPPGQVRLGQSVEVRIASKRRGWLVLLDVNSAGEVARLLPDGAYADLAGTDDGAGNGAADPAASYAINFIAGKPTGKGTLIAIVIDDAASLEALAKQYVAPQANTGDLSTIVRQLRAIWAKDGSSHSLRWSMTEAAYDIAP